MIKIKSGMRSGDIKEYEVSMCKNKIQWGSYHYFAYDIRRDVIHETFYDSEDGVIFLQRWSKRRIVPITDLDKNWLMESEADVQYHLSPYLHKVHNITIKEDTPPARYLPKLMKLFEKGDDLVAMHETLAVVSNMPTPDVPTRESLANCFFEAVSHPNNELRYKAINLVGCLLHHRRDRIPPHILNTFISFLKDDSYMIRGVVAWTLFGVFNCTLFYKDTIPLVR